MNGVGAPALPDTDRPDGAAAVLRTTTAVRERAGQLLTRARAGASPWFSVHDNGLQTAAVEVAELTRARYPDLKIPYHSRWRHFEAGGVDRNAVLESRMTGLDPSARAHAMIDLAVVSVLLDAGAGPDWHYREAATGQVFARSEALGVASWHAFVDGLFSSDRTRPLQVDSDALLGMTEDRLAEAFQAGAANPIVGLEGRVLMLRRLGAALAAQPEVFGSAGRPGGLFNLLTGRPGAVAADDILSQVLVSLSGIWPADNVIGTEPLGDCWRHSSVSGAGLTDGWMPFHKLSQWLTYSLLEPFGWAGVGIDRLEALTALPEYRNGGLLLDTGALRLRNPAWSGHTWAVDDEVVVEWRALTVALLDELATVVRALLDVEPADMPLACVLEGGTWAAGRASAQRLRGGLPPLTIASDGTVF